MGLDMYLTAGRYLSPYGDEETLALINELNAKHGLDPVSKNDYHNPIRVRELIFEVAYWRKANAIHNWFVKNVQDGVDDCKDYYVDRVQLVELIGLCKTVLDDHSKAEELLPRVNGFFFGGTEYDEYYYDDLKNTIEMLEKVLKMSTFDHFDFYYHSSW
jgi:hypothetical protein